MVVGTRFATALLAKHFPPCALLLAIDATSLRPLSGSIWRQPISTGKRPQNRAPFPGPESGAASVKADSRPSPFRPRIAGHHMAPFLAPTVESEAAGRATGVPAHPSEFVLQCSCLSVFAGNGTSTTPEAPAGPPAPVPFLVARAFMAINMKSIEAPLSTTHAFMDIPRPSQRREHPRPLWFYSFSCWSVSNSRKQLRSSSPCCGGCEFFVVGRATGARRIPKPVSE